MSFQLIKSALLPLQAVNARMSLDGWIADETARAAKVALFRAYADGDHRADLTDHMRKMLRIASDGTLNEFTDDYTDVVIQTMADRLEVDKIEADNASATQWLETLLQENQFDQIQMDVHEATIRDADSYVMLAWDNEEKRVVMTHEPAFDGTSGMMVVYGERGIDVAIKVWVITSESTELADTVRVNVYLPGEIRKYVSEKGGPLTKFEEPAVWTLKDGSPIGVPVIHFRNRRKKHHNYGLSEIEKVVPIQDMINRSLYSMIMAEEMTAFQVRVAKGFSPPSGLTPGMWVEINVTDQDGNVQPLTNQDQVDAFVLETAPLAPYIEVLKFLTNEVGRITRTPAPEFMWANTSGESLKQREIGLLGKVERFQVSAGNAWAEVAKMAALVQQAYGDTPAAAKRWTTHWQSAEIRDDAQVIANAMLIKDQIPYKTFLEIIAPVYEWDQRKIDEIVKLKELEDQARLAVLAASIPRFGGNPQTTTAAA